MDGYSGGGWPAILQALQNIVTATNAQAQIFKNWQPLALPLVVGSGGTGVTVRGATQRSTPANPAATVNLTATMMGLAGSFTPKTTGTMFLIVSGTVTNDTAPDGWVAQLRYGTGSAPANGTNPAVGTLIGAPQGGIIAAGSANVTFSLHDIVSGLTVGTPYWFDIAAYAITAGTVTVANVMMNGYELTV